MSLADFQTRSLPNFVIYCDLAHGFDELLVMADSRFNRDARNYYGSPSADPALPVTWTVYRTLQVNTVTTNSQAQAHDEQVIKARKTTFKPSGNTWEYKDSLSVYCPKCELKALSVDKTDLALWLDPLIDSGTIQTGNKGDYLLSVASVWEQFEGISSEVLKEAVNKRTKRLK
jgi:hypothetical protein